MKKTLTFIVHRLQEVLIFFALGFILIADIIFIPLVFSRNILLETKTYYFPVLRLLTRVKMSDIFEDK